MSAIAERGLYHQSERRLGFRDAVSAAIRHQLGLFLAITFAFPVIFYAFLLAMLVSRFGHLPNYVTPYDWIGNVIRIVESTGAMSDMVKISLDEWLLEIGYMNYDYGHGISEWSLTIIPHKLLFVTFIGALVALNLVLLLDRKPTGTTPQQCVKTVRSAFLTSIGAACASITSVTLFWVICCATPSWIVGFAILGLGTSTALALEPIGPAISLIGIAILAVSALWIVRSSEPVVVDATAPQPAKGGARC
jgi:hypothetical protein